MKGIETFIKADIFFFIASIAVIFLTIVVVVAVIYAIKILRDVRYISGRAREETDKVVNDIGFFRSFVRKFFKVSKSKKKFSKKK